MIWVLGSPGNYLGPTSRHYIAPAAIQGFDRVKCAKLLGVWLQDYFGVSKHCDYILKICNQRLCLINLLKGQGLPWLQLQTAFRTILISRLLYAVHTWSGFAHTADTECIQKMLIKAFRQRSHEMTL